MCFQAMMREKAQSQSMLKEKAFKFELKTKAAQKTVERKQHISIGFGSFFCVSVHLKKFSPLLG